MSFTDEEVTEYMYVYTHTHTYSSRVAKGIEREGNPKSCPYQELRWQRVFGTRLGMSSLGGTSLQVRKIML